MRTKALWALVVGAVLLGGLAAPLEASSQQDAVIRRAFEDVLDREPSDRELRRYRDLMYEEHWTERDIRDDLRSRSDYQRNSQRNGPGPGPRRPPRLPGHPPPGARHEGLRLYRSRMIDQDWTEQDVREALRKSPEYAKRSSESADKIIRRAYQDVLGREPDTNGLYSYRNKVLNQGWDEHDVSEALRKSPEFRQKNAMTREQAERGRRAGPTRASSAREPGRGRAGATSTTCCGDHWSEADVARELRNSDEYRSKRQ